MLLEHLLSTTHPDSSKDVSKQSNSVSSLANGFSAKNTEQFKSALNNSIENRQKYLIKQNDEALSESELLHAIQEWDKLYSNAEGVFNKESGENINQFLSNEEAAKLVIATKNQRFHIDQIVGNKVPADGNKLPINDSTKGKSIDASVNANATLKSADLIISNTPKSVSAEKTPLLQQSIDATTKSTATAIVDPQPLSKSPNKEGELLLTAAIKPITPKIDSLLLKDKLSTIEGVIKNQSFEAPKIKDIATNASSTELKADDKSSALNKAELIANLLSGTKKITAGPNKNRVEKNLTKSIASANNPILKSANISAETTKTEVVSSKQSEVVNPSILLKSELDKQFNDPSQILQLKPGTDGLLQTLKRDDVVASLLPTTNATYDSSTSSGVKPLHVSVIESNLVQSQTNSIQNVNKSSEAPLTVGVSANKWNQKFAEHVSMLALRGTSNAQIRLDPPELGPMAIRINHTGTETQVQFMVHNAVAKELVDSGMQRLREMLEQHGFDNVNVDVNEFTKEQQNLSDNELFTQDTDEKIDELQTNSDSNQDKVKSNALIDLFV